MTKILAVGQHKAHFYKFFQDSYQEAIQDFKQKIDNKESFDFNEFNATIARAMISKILYGQGLEQ